MLISYKKEEESFNFEHETGFKLQKPGHNTSAYVFSSCQGAFFIHQKPLFPIHLLRRFTTTAGSEKSDSKESRKTVNHKEVWQLLMEKV